MLPMNESTHSLFVKQNKHQISGGFEKKKNGDGLKKMELMKIQQQQQQEQV